MSIQEAIDLSEITPHLPRLFGHEILGRLPQAGQPRVRRTMLGVIGMPYQTLDSLVFILSYLQGPTHHGLQAFQIIPVHHRQQ
jgi:hypothetical protein